MIHLVSKPAALVHVDQTADAAVNLVHKHLPADASKLLGGRFQVINLWRPIANCHRLAFGPL